MARLSDMTKLGASRPGKGSIPGRDSTESRIASSQEPARARMAMTQPHGSGNMEREPHHLIRRFLD